jgi:hypothetical protein
LVDFDDIEDLNKILKVIHQRSAELLSDVFPLLAASAVWLVHKTRKLPTSVFQFLEAGWLVIPERFLIAFSDDDFLELQSKAADVSVSITY